MRTVRLPLQKEDVMKLLDKALDRAVEMTKPVMALAEGLKACAIQMELLAQNLAVVAHNQAVHRQMIIQMWEVQQAIFRRLKGNSLDASMPDIDRPDAKDQASIERAKAALKPN